MHSKICEERVLVAVVGVNLIEWGMGGWGGPTSLQ